MRLSSLDLLDFVSAADVANFCWGGVEMLVVRGRIWIWSRWL